MTHDPLCPALEGEGLFVAYAGPVGGSDHIDCLTCYIVALVREDEKRTLPPTERHREWWVAFGMGKLAGHKDGYAAALRDCEEAVRAALGADERNLHAELTVLAAIESLGGER